MVRFRRLSKRSVVGAVVLMVLAAISLANWAERGRFGLPEDGVVWTDSEAGVSASWVESEGPAALVGVRPGDILISIGGRRVGAALDATRFLAEVGAWSRTQYEIERDGRLHRFSIVVGESASRGTVGRLSPDSRLGLRVDRAPGLPALPGESHDYPVLCLLPRFAGGLFAERDRPVRHLRQAGLLARRLGAAADAAPLPRFLRAFRGSDAAPARLPPHRVLPGGRRRIGSPCRRGRLGCGRHRGPRPGHILRFRSAGAARGQRPGGRGLDPDRGQGFGESTSPAANEMAAVWRGRGNHSVRRVLRRPVSGRFRARTQSGLRGVLPGAPAGLHRRGSDSLQADGLRTRLAAFARFRPDLRPPAGDRLRRPFRRRLGTGLAGTLRPDSLAGLLDPGRPALHSNP